MQPPRLADSSFTQKLYQLNPKQTLKRLVISFKYTKYLPYVTHFMQNSKQIQMFFGIVQEDEAYQA